MILAPRYSSSEPPPASGPVRSKTTPILIFFSWAWAETAIPNTATAAISPPSRWAALRTGIKTSLKNCVSDFFLVLLTPITRGAPADVKRLAPRTRRQKVVNPGAGCADASGARAAEKSVNLLVLLRHEVLCLAALLIGAAQHGHRRKFLTRTRTSRRRMVAIEFGMCRSGRSGGASGSVTFGNARRLEHRGGTRC